MCISFKFQLIFVFGLVPSTGSCAASSTRVSSGVVKTPPCSWCAWPRPWPTSRSTKTPADASNSKRSAPVKIRPTDVTSDCCGPWPSCGSSSFGFFEKIINFIFIHFTRLKMFSVDLPKKYISIRKLFYKSNSCISILNKFSSSINGVYIQRTLHL